MGREMSRILRNRGFFFAMGSLFLFYRSSSLYYTIAFIYHRSRLYATFISCIFNALRYTYVFQFIFFSAFSFMFSIFNIISLHTSAINGPFLLPCLYILLLSFIHYTYIFIPLSTLYTLSITLYIITHSPLFNLHPSFYNAHFLLL